MPSWSSTSLAVTPPPPTDRYGHTTHERREKGGRISHNAKRPAAHTHLHGEDLGQDVLAHVYPLAREAGELGGVPEGNGGRARVLRLQRCELFALDGDALGQGGRAEQVARRREAAQQLARRLAYSPTSPLVSQHMGETPTTRVCAHQRRGMLTPRTAAWAAVA